MSQHLTESATSERTLAFAQGVSARSCQRMQRDGFSAWLAALECAESTSSAPATERAQPPADVHTRRASESDGDMVSLDAGSGTAHDASEAETRTVMVPSSFSIHGQETNRLTSQLPTAQMQAAAALPNVMPERPITSPHAHVSQFAACSYAVTICNSTPPSAIGVPLAHSISANKSIAPTIGESVSLADAQVRRTRRRRREMQSTYRVRQSQRAQELARILKLPINTQLHTLCAKTIAQIITLQARAGLPVSQLPQLDDNFEG